MGCNYGKYPFCKQCKQTGEKCQDYYAKKIYEENKKEVKNNGYFI